MHIDFFKNNLFLKVIALILGIFIWFYSFLEENLIFELPVQSKVIFFNNEKKSSYMEYSDTIYVDFEGKRKDFLLLKLLKKIPLYEIKVEEESNGEKNEVLNFDNIIVPKQVNLNPIKFKNRRVLKYFIDDKEFKKVIVKPVFNNFLNAKLSFYKDIEVTPQMIEISGPSILLKNIDFVETEGVDLLKVNKSKITTVKIKKINFVDYETNNVTLKIFVEKKVTKIFKNIPVLFVNRDKRFHILPDSLNANIKVEGPVSILEKILPGELTLTLDLASVNKKGEYSLRLNPPVIEFLKVISIEPFEVRIVVE